MNDKHHVTGVFTVTLDDQLLPMQLIYQKSTKVCLPHVKVLSDYWHVTSSPNHWDKEVITKDYNEKLFNPHLM